MCLRYGWILERLRTDMYVHVESSLDPIRERAPLLLARFEIVFVTILPSTQQTKVGHKRFSKKEGPGYNFEVTEAEWPLNECCHMARMGRQLLQLLASVLSSHVR